MESGLYNLGKLFKHLSKSSFGVRYTKERFDVLNKFGLFYDSINKEDQKWSQKANAESGQQMLNLFDYTNADNHMGMFLSTTRFGISINDISNKKGEIINPFIEKQKDISMVLKKMTDLFCSFNLIRFGIYFEYLLLEQEVESLSSLKLFKWLVGNNLSITNYDEINQRYSYKVKNINKDEYSKIIIQFSKVLVNNGKEEKYLLTTDYQSFFIPVQVNSYTELNEFSSKKINNIYDEYIEYFKGLTIVIGKEQDE
jgi:hypothetical protein